LEHKGPWVLANATTVGDSTSQIPTLGASLLSSSSRIRQRGVNVVSKITYPGDRGLAGQGLPATGIKISDKVEVWAGNDIDAEVEAARQ